MKKLDLHPGHINPGRAFALAAFATHAKIHRLLDGGAGQSAFEQSLAQSFKSTYDSTGDFWTQAPSKPTAAGLFSSSLVQVTAPGLRPGLKVEVPAP